MSNTNSFTDLFKRKSVKSQNITVGDVGIYHDVLTYYNQNDTGDTVKHNVYTKVKVLQVFHDLVEVEVLDTVISDNVHPCVQELAKTNICKYVSPKSIKWEIKN